MKPSLFWHQPDSAVKARRLIDFNLSLGVMKEVDVDEHSRCNALRLVSITLLGCIIWREKDIITV